MLQPLAAVPLLHWWVLRTLQLLDEETLVNSVRKTGHVLIVHEAVQTGGFGGEIAARLAASKAFHILLRM